MIQNLKQIIYNTVIEANRKMTPGEVEKAVAGISGIDRKTVRLAIKDLVGLGELSYTYLYGTSFLEKSFDRPVRISKRIVIKPPGKAYRPQPEEVVIDLAAGAAFGNGAHPTTCLALQALDFALGDKIESQRKPSVTGLDVGTGTGVLAIALAKLGVQEVIGIDIDACAISEATQNVCLNNLAARVAISNAPLEDLKTCFSVVVANLAYPTLRRLSSLLSEKMEQNGVLVLSGFKEPASKDLGKTYAEQGLRLIREETDREWVCLVLRKS
ncbi:MAG: 50S ribosomal protein L11 methyltransferase [Deltaproteobacteria bacterium]|nr:50S ribosomal protein L11 methyltransferase [Deltaproteobacteria bacterium]